MRIIIKPTKGFWYNYIECLCLIQQKKLF